MVVDLDTGEIAYLRGLAEERNFALRKQLTDLVRSRHGATFPIESAREMRRALSCIAKLDGALRH